MDSVEVTAEFHRWAYSDYWQMRQEPALSLSPVASFWNRRMAQSWSYMARSPLSLGMEQIGVHFFPVRHFQILPGYDLLFNVYNTGCFFLLNWTRPGTRAAPIPNEGNAAEADGFVATETS